jgi:hypothetical protein
VPAGSVAGAAFAPVGAITPGAVRPRGTNVTVWKPRTSKRTLSPAWMVMTRGWNACTSASA